MKVIFVSATKIGENTTNILKLLFFIVNLHSVTSNQISTYRKLNLPLTSSIYLVFLPLEMQGRLKQTKVYHMFFYFAWKEMTHNPLKVAAAKTLLSSVCYCYNFLQWIFFILCDNWKTLLFITVYRYSSNRHVVAFFEASVLKEVRILCVISTITVRC